jgi:riboflavin biosynthesis pyrimidine reductase
MLRSVESSEPVDVLETLFSERREHQGKPWVMLNMIESVDGATALKGGATALNDEDDRALFLALRSVADVVLVGAQTVRSEALGPVRMSDEMTRYRREAGFSDPPRLAIITRSLDLDPTHRVFSDPSKRPIILTTEDADVSRLEAMRPVADVTQAPSLDGAGIVRSLGDARVILCEGGPTVNSHLIAGGVVDEINLTVAPMFTLGESKRVAFGPELDPTITLVLDRVFLGDRSLFLRYVRDWNL